jgi:hypothetical protein
LKVKTPTGIKVLRAVSITITIIVILVIGSVVYSAYQDYTAFRSELGGGSQQVSGKAVLQGSSEIISINFTVPNMGLYALNVTVTCDQHSANVVCPPTQVTVPGGQQSMLRFRMTVLNVSQFVASGNHRINGTVAIALVPFAAFSIGVDLGGFVKTGGP